MQWRLILHILMGQCCFITSQLYEYHFVNQNKNWTEAQQYCKETYSDLATVSNMTDVKRILNMSAENNTEAWIGLYEQTGVNRTWRWSLPGLEFNQNETNWERGEPNCVQTENCATVSNKRLWIDLSCSDKKYFLCFDEKQLPQKYYLITEEKTWLEAQRYCRENHTDLISGLSQLQDEQIKNDISLANEPMFMGLFRDSWRWSDESSISFRHWNLQFDDKQHNGARCASTVFNEGWKPDSCDTEKPFFCYDDKVTLIRENKTWEEALYYCRDHHHDLVTITSLDEQRWVQQKAKMASTPFVWMGLRYTCTLDFWFWVSDEVVSYKNWVSDGPMDDCDMSGAMATGGQHQWFKRNDNEEFNFICSEL